MGELLDFLFICVLIFYILRAVFRFLIPVLFQKVVNKAQQQKQQHQYRATENQQQNHNRANTGRAEVKVDYVPPQNKKKGSIPDSAGDFIDYEEVK